MGSVELGEKVKLLEMLEAEKGELSSQVGALGAKLLLMKGELRNRILMLLATALWIIVSILKEERLELFLKVRPCLKTRLPLRGIHPPRIDLCFSFFM